MFSRSGSIAAEPAAAEEPAHLRARGLREPRGSEWDPGAAVEAPDSPLYSCRCSESFPQWWCSFSSFWRPYRRPAPAGGLRLTVGDFGRIGRYRHGGILLLEGLRLGLLGLLGAVRVSRFLLGGGRGLQRIGGLSALSHGAAGILGGRLLRVNSAESWWAPGRSGSSPSCRVSCWPHRPRPSGP